MGGSIPVLIYDDDCGVCTRAARWVGARGSVELRGFSALLPSERERLPREWRDCAHLLMDGEIYSCGEAMERAFELTNHPMVRVLRPLRRLPGYDRLREAAYRTFAARRGLVGRLLSD